MGRKTSVHPLRSDDPAIQCGATPLCCTIAVAPGSPEYLSLIPQGVLHSTAST